MNAAGNFQRFQKWSHQGLGPNGRNLCYCGCGREVSPPRQTSFSKECYQKWREKNDAQTIRRIVYERDKGVCALCGVDTNLQQQIAKETKPLLLWLAKAEAKRLFLQGELWIEHKRVRVKAIAWGEIGMMAERWVREYTKELGWPIRTHHWWEADHIIPVSEGGGGCGPEGYRTLCLRCHKAETAKLKARLAVRKRAA